MKNINYLVPMVLCLLATACQQDELVSQNDNKQFVSVNAMMESPSTRSSVDENNGTFSWTIGDTIDIWVQAVGEEAAFQYLLFKEENKKFEGTLQGSDLKYSQYAVYPHSTKHMISESTLSVNLPATYDYSEKEIYTPNTNALMVAKIGEATPTLNKLHFYHAGGVLSVKVANLPKDACGIKLTTNKEVTGDVFSVTNPNSETPSITTTDKSSNNTITILFKQLTESCSEAIQFYFPLPTGDGYTFTLDYLLPSELENGSYKEVPIKKGTTLNNIHRGELLVMPTLTLTSTEADAENIGYSVTTNIEGEITYVVHNAKGLQTVNTLVQNDLDANITLANDIIMTDDLKDTEGNNWRPLGTVDNPYTGIFNGNNKSITGLTFTSTGSNNGLIACLNGKVEKLTLNNIKYSITEESSRLGGIVGYAKGGSITDCIVNNVQLSGTGPCLGGIAGKADSGVSITRCSAEEVTITGNNKSYGVGGIVGENQATISNCDVDDVPFIPVAHHACRFMTFQQYLVGLIPGITIHTLIL